MAFNNKTFRKNGELSKTAFVDAIAKINNAESVTGVKYNSIDVVNGIICGIRESTNEPFSISADALYNAYCELDIFNTTALKPYVNRVQSPAMAILIASKLVTPIEAETTAKNPKVVTTQAKTSMSTQTPSGKKRIRGVNCPFCHNYVSIPKEQDQFENVTCPYCSNLVQNPNYAEKRYFGIKKSVLLFIIGVIFFALFFAYINNREDVYIENGELQPAAKVEAITMIKRNLKNPSSYSGHGWTQGNWDPTSDTERYFLLHYFTVTNEYGQKEDQSATVIFDKDGHVTRVVISR